SKRDWSSDVCSSDLPFLNINEPSHHFCESDVPYKFITVHHHFHFTVIIQQTSDAPDRLKPAPDKNAVSAFLLTRSHDLMTPAAPHTAPPFRQLKMTAFTNPFRL